MNECISSPFYASLSKIAWLLCEDITPGSIARQKAGLDVALLSSPVSVEFHGDAFLKHVSDSGGSKTETTLSFNSISDIPIDMPIAFVVEIHDGRRFLIGADSTPYPALSKSFNTGSSPKEAAGFSYSLKWNFPPAKCVAWLNPDISKVLL